MKIQEVLKENGNKFSSPADAFAAMLVSSKHWANKQSIYIDARNAFEDFTNGLKDAEIAIILYVEYYKYGDIDLYKFLQKFYLRYFNSKEEVLNLIDKYARKFNKSFGKAMYVKN